MDIFIQQVVSGLATGGIYASLALALVMIYQATDVVNFAQGSMAMFSTYLCWSLLQMGLSYWVAFFATLVIAFAGGLLIERIVIRPVEDAPILTIVIVTLALFGPAHSVHETFTCMVPARPPGDEYRVYAELLGPDQPSA